MHAARTLGAVLMSLLLAGTAAAQDPCAGCMQQADTPAKKKQCQETICRKAAGK